MSKYINADVLKANVEKIKVIVDENVFKCEAMHDTLAYLLKRIEKAVNDIIDAQPVADVSPVVHAEWEHRYNDFGEQIDDRWYCSQCAGCNEYRRTWHCPECGAKMDGKEVKE